MIVDVTSKNGEDPSKNEGTRVDTLYLPSEAYGDFSGHSRAANTSVPVQSCRISNPSKILWLSLLPARIKKKQSKMKE